MLLPRVPDLLMLPSALLATLLPASLLPAGLLLGALSLGGPALSAQEAGDHAETGDPPLQARLFGRVLDATGRPLDDAELTLTDQGGAPVGDPLTRTDAAGWFALTAAQADRAEQASRQGGALLLTRRGRASLALRPGSGDVGDLTMFPGMLWSGRVVDEAGAPVVGAVVTASVVPELGGSAGSTGDVFEMVMLGFRRQSLGGMSAEAATATPMARVRTGTDGHFRLAGAPGEGVFLTVSHTEFIDARTGLLALGDRPELCLLRAGSVRGEVVGADGEPLQARVRLVSDDGEDQRVSSAANGRFALLRTSRSAGWLRASCDGHAPFEERLPAGGDDVTGVRIQMRPAAEASAAAGGVADASGRGLPGRVVEAAAVRPGPLIDVVDATTGEPVREVRAGVVWHLPEEVSVSVASLLSMSRAQPVDAEEPRLASPGPGEQSGLAIVLAPGYSPLQVRVPRPDAEADEPAPFRIELQPAARLQGRVVDAVSGAPVAGARVRFEESQGQRNNRVFINVAGPSGDRQPGPFEVRCDDEGRYQIEDLPTGAGELKVQAEGYSEAAEAVALTHGEATQVDDLRLQPAVAVRGRVLAPGLPSGCLVELRAEQGVGGRMVVSNGQMDAVAWSRLDAEGRFELPKVTAGAWRLDLVLPRSSHGPRIPPVELHGFSVEGAEPIDLGELDAAAALPVAVEGRVDLGELELPRGRLVVRASKRPSGTDAAVVQIRMMLAMSGGGQAATGPVVPVDLSGSFRIALTPGEWDLQLIDLLSGLRLAAGTAEIDAGRGTQRMSLTGEVGRLRVLLPDVRPGGFAGQWLVLRDPAAGGEQRGLVIGPGAAPSGMGTGRVALHSGQAEYDLLVPTGRLQVELFAHRAPTLDQEQAVRRDFDRRRLQAGSGTAQREVTVAAGGQAKLTFRFD